MSGDTVIEFVSGQSPAQNVTNAQNELKKAKKSTAVLAREVAGIVNTCTGLLGEVVIPESDLQQLKKLNSKLGAAMRAESIAAAPGKLAKLEEQEKWLEAASGELKYYSDLATAVVEPIQKALDLTESLTKAYGTKEALASIERLRNGFSAAARESGKIKFLGNPGFSAIIKKIAILGIAADGITLVRGIMDRDIKAAVKGGTGVAGGTAAYFIGGSAGTVVGGGIVLAGLVFIELEGLAEMVKEMRISNAAGQTMRVLDACDGVVVATSAWQGASDLYIDIDFQDPRVAYYNFRGEMWQASRNVLVALRKLESELGREKALRKQIFTGYAAHLLGSGLDAKRKGLTENGKYGAHLFMPTMDVEPMLSQIGAAAIDRLIAVRAVEAKQKALLIRSLQKRWKLKSNYTPIGHANYVYATAD
jgi:hypothetical protein